ncbi:MAG: hypothetical protein AAGC92_12430 [Pseudomonadota bacterium]
MTDTDNAMRGAWVQNTDRIGRRARRWGFQPLKRGEASPLPLACAVWQPAIRAGQIVVLETQSRRDLGQALPA